MVFDGCLILLVAVFAYRLELEFLELPDVVLVVQELKAMVYPEHFDEKHLAVGNV